MAKREMPEQPISISEQEWNGIRDEVVGSVNEIEAMIPEQPKASKTTIGIVVNCKKLNLRTKPSKAANIIYEMPADSKLTINLDRSINGWLSVCTESGLEGFCMKEFVSIK